MPGNKSGDVVALPAESTDMLVEQMCQDLDCGSVYHVNKTSSPPNRPTTCFHDCVYQDGRLQNCSQSAGGNCTVIAEAVCGKVVSNMSSTDDRIGIQRNRVFISLIKVLLITCKFSYIYSIYF